MEIKTVIPEPYENSVSPSIIFEIEISYTKYQEAIIAVSGWLETDDGKIVVNISEYPSGKPKTSEICAKGTNYDSKFKEEVYITNIIAQLDKQSLDHIEKRRMADKKGDVKLTLDLNVKYLETRAVILGSYLIDPKKIGLPGISIPTSRGREDAKIIAHAYDPEFSTQYENLSIISGNTGPVFLAMGEHVLKKNIRIPSADWLYDYAPKLGLGEYFIVEILKGEEVIKKAWSYVEKAEECFRKWDTKGVFANCREGGKLLNKTIKGKFGDSPIIKKWRKAIVKFNELSSLALHVEDIKEQKPEGDVKIGKAEAEHILIVTKALVKYAEELLRTGI